jgi:hypothetical protein
VRPSGRASLTSAPASMSARITADVAVDARQPQRRAAVPVRGPRVCARLQERFHEVGPPSIDGPVQCRRAVALRRVDVGPAGHQRTDGREIAVHGRICAPRPPGSRPNSDCGEDSGRCRGGQRGRRATDVAWRVSRGLDGRGQCHRCTYRRTRESPGAVAQALLVRCRTRRARSAGDCRSAPVLVGYAR